MPGEKYIPQRIEMDAHDTFVPANAARYIKNLIHSMDDTSLANAANGGQAGVFKPLESNAVYVDDFVLPEGTVQGCGKYSFKNTKEAFIFTYSSLGNHGIFRINGSTATIDTVIVDPTLNFQLNPEFFINGDGGAWLEVVNITDPVTGVPKRRTFLFFTDIFNDQGFICVEDAIATKGFDPVAFPFFSGNYDRNALIRMACPTPNDCISISEIPLTQTSAQLSNNLLYNTKQFRLRYIDVWGRPTEYGIISDMYIPGGGGCIQESTNLPRCLALMFKAPPPHVNQVEIVYRNCNDTQWYLSDTLDLYVGSPLGQWWTRQRNPDVVFDSNKGTITYTFCAQEGCDPVDPTLTSRLFNPLPRNSNSVAKIGKYMGVGGNRRGFLPFSQDVKNKFSATVTPPGQTANAARKIEIYLEIYNPFLNQNQPIYQSILAGNNKVYGFGGFGSRFQSGAFGNYKQYFINPNQTGLVGVLAGTGSYVFSEQYVMDSTGTFKKVTDFVNVHNTDPTSTSLNPVRYFQKFTFTNLNPQTYVFRITSPQSDPLVDPSYEKTSTFIRGSFSCNFVNPTAPLRQVDHSKIVSDAKELVINVCDGDYNTLTSNSILVLYDLCGSSVRAGYVKNTNSNTEDQIGIELLKIGFTNPAQIFSKYTDHNGYFFAASQASGHGSQYSISGYCSCKLVNFTGNIDMGSDDSLQENDWFLNNNVNCSDYTDVDCNFILVNGKVVICGTNVGVPGVGIVLARGGVAFTDNNGEFSLISHDDVLVPGPRQDNLYFITSSCAFTDCDGGCIMAALVIIPKCSTCGSREVSVPLVSVKYTSLKGLLSGGTYPWGVVGWDWADRPGFVQPLGNLIIPSVYESQVFGPSQVGVEIDPSIVLPAVVKSISFWIGQEATIQEYIDWIVDSVVFVDNTGQENTAAPTQIKIFYASLIEYNKQNNFNTTVNWQFLAAPVGTTTQTPVTTDRVQFLMNGDGTFFSKNIVSLVKYDQAGQYFLINYTPDLASLQANARVRLFRPKQCVFSETSTAAAPYFELCSTIQVANGKPASFSAILNAFDTYYIYRGIIPVPTAQPGTSPLEYLDEPRLQGIPFEHNSPSDFWGQGCANLGRVNSNNEQETEIYDIDKIALSDALSDTGQLNFLCFFEDNRVVDFSDAQINGITAIIPETSTVLIVGQSDHFIVGFNDNLLRINNDGTAQAGSVANAFGLPQRKAGQNWGCQLFDKNTIYKKEGLVHWLDTTKAVLVQHNYGRAINLAKEDPKNGVPGGIDGWLRVKIKEIQQFNQKGFAIRYWHGVVNPQACDYILTDYTVGADPVNNSREVDVTLNETMVIGIFTKMVKMAAGFVPEMYTEIEGEIGSQQLFALWKGVPWSFYNDISVNGYGKMFGVNMVRVFEPLVVMDGMIKKKPLSIGVICKQSQYFVDRAVTESGQETRMLLSQWIEAIYGWYAPFLCDLKTPYDPNRPEATGPNVLTDGNMLVGNFVKVRLIGDPSKDNDYSELQGITVSVFADGNNLTNK